MAWIRIDDHFDEHPKLAAVGPLGWGVWLAGLAYCNRNLTDGFIPYHVADRIAGSWRVRVPTPDGRVQVWTITRSSGMVGEDMDAQWVIELLVRAGLWEEVEGGYRVHDYLDYQPSRAEVEAEREAARERMRRARGRRGGNTDTHENSTGSSGEVRANIAGSSPNPKPNPNPDPTHRNTPPYPPTGGEAAGGVVGEQTVEPQEQDRAVAVAAHYRERIGLLSSGMFDQLDQWLQDGMSPDVLMAAIDETAAARDAGEVRRSVDGLLKSKVRDWFNRGIRTVDDLQRSRQPRAVANGPPVEGAPNADAYTTVDAEAVKRWRQMFADEYDQAGVGR